MPLYALTPQDVLFFRDGRPIEATGGHGARWPEPSLIFDAIHAALHRAFRWMTKPGGHLRKALTLGSMGTGLAGLLTAPRPASGPSVSARCSSIGPFPILENGEWLFPSPQDVVPSPVLEMGARGVCSAGALTFFARWRKTIRINAICLRR